MEQWLQTAADNKQNFVSMYKIKNKKVNLFGYRRIGCTPTPLANLGNACTFQQRDLADCLTTNDDADEAMLNKIF